MSNNHLNNYKTTGKINLKKIEENINQLKVIVHPVRYAIIVLIMVNKRMNVTEIYNELSISQTVTSGHLKLLSGNDFLCVKKVGKNSYYSLNQKTLRKLMEAMRPTIN